MAAWMEWPLDFLRVGSCTANIDGACKGEMSARKRGGQMPSLARVKSPLARLSAPRRDHVVQVGRGSNNDGNQCRSDQMAAHARSGRRRPRRGPVRSHRVRQVVKGA